jgi:hypothetical protein
MIISTTSSSNDYKKLSHEMTISSAYQPRMNITSESRFGAVLRHKDIPCGR